MPFPKVLILSEWYSVTEVTHLLGCHSSTCEPRWHGYKIKVSAPNFLIIEGNIGSTIQKRVTDLAGAAEYISAEV